MRASVVSEEVLLEAVADTSRRRVLDLLLAHDAITPPALAAELPFSRQAVAKHLMVLDRAGLVTSTRQGREVRYSVRPEHLDLAVHAMAKVAARWMLGSRQSSAWPKPTRPLRTKGHAARPRSTPDVFPIGIRTTTFH